MGKFKGIIIVSDYDGTFYNGNKESRVKNIAEVERFKNNGGLFTFATGRDRHSLMAIEPEYENIVNAPIIMANGSRLYDSEKNQYLFDYTLNLSLFSEFYEIIFEKYPDMGIRFSCENGLVIPVLNKIIENDLTDMFTGNISVREMPVKDLIKSGEKVYKCVMIHDPEKLDFVRETGENFNKNNNHEFCFTRTYSRGLETVNINASKGASALRLKQYLNTRDNLEYKLFTIGDYDNDLDMIKAADYGAAPENALESVKKSAKIHTVGCSDGAVADLIRIIEKEYL